MKHVFQWLCLLMLCVASLTAGCGDSRSDEQRLQDALESLDAGKYRAAVVDLKNLLRIDPNNRSVRLALGEASLMMGDAAAAEKELMRARELGADPNDYAVPWARALMMRSAFAELISEIDPATLSDVGQKSIVMAYRASAVLSLNEDAAAQAETMFDKIISDAVSPEAQRLALQGKAELAKRKGDLAGAENLVRRSLDLVPDSAASTLALGQVLLIGQKFEEAEKVFVYGRNELKSTAIEQFFLHAGQVEALLGQDRIEDGAAAADELAVNSPNHPMTGYLRGRTAFQRGDMTAAIEILQETLSKFPNYPDAEALLGAANLQIGDLAQAEMHLASSLSAKPGNTLARQLLAETRLQMKRPDEAAATLREGLRTDSGNAALLAMLGRTSVNLGDNEEGIRYLTESLEASPDNTQIMLTLAAAYISAGQPDEAKELINTMPEGALDEQRRDVLLMFADYDRDDSAYSIEKISALSDKWQDDAAVLNIVGSFFQSAGDLNKARASFARVMELEPDNRNALFSIGRLDDATGDYTQSKALFERYLELKEDDVLAILAVSRILEREGDSAKSLEYVQRANKIDPNALLPNLILAGRAILASDLETAERLTRIAVKKHPNASQAHSTLAVVLFRADRAEEALESMKRAVANKPDHAPFHFYRGQLEKRLSMLAQARVSFAHAWRLDKTNLQAARELAFLDVKAGNSLEAQQIVDDLKKSFPDSAGVFEVEGDIFTVQNEHAKAQAAYIRARDINPTAAIAAKMFRGRALSGAANIFSPLEDWLNAHPEDGATRLLLAQELQRRQRKDEAIEQYEMIIEMAPKSLLALNNAAWLYHERENTDDRLRALELSKRAYDLAPGSPDVADTYGWILVRSGQLKTGTDVLRNALNATNAKDSPDIAYHLAAALQEGGDRDEARGLLNQALSGQRNFASRRDAQTLLDSL